MVKNNVNRFEELLKEFYNDDKFIELISLLPLMKIRKEARDKRIIGASEQMSEYELLIIELEHLDQKLGG